MFKTKNYAVPLPIFDKLKKHVSKNIFKRVAMKYIIKNLKVEDIQELNSAFAALDIDKTGFITVYQL